MLLLHFTNRALQCVGVLGTGMGQCNGGLWVQAVLESIPEILFMALQSGCMRIGAFARAESTGLGLNHK